MPISTPKEHADRYQDPAHFSHVLASLFVPAVKTAGLKPIPPLAEGADLIHENIIKNLIDADLVLCDISAFNPNVFFELGVRTALNKPVCYVKDKLTEKIPFDTSVINHYEYDGALTGWTLDDGRSRLSDHIKTTIERSAGKNHLWQRFGVNLQAERPVPGSQDDTLRMLTLELAGVNSRLDSIEARTQIGGSTVAESDYFASIVSRHHGVNAVHFDGDSFIIMVSDDFRGETADLIRKMAGDAGYRIVFMRGDIPESATRTTNVRKKLGSTWEGGKAGG